METSVRNRLIGAAAMLAACVTAAGAADYPAPQPYAPPYAQPYPAAGFSWVGGYLGANFGYQWDNLSQSGARPSGPALGITGGYNWQFGQFVLGGETDFNLTDATGAAGNYRFTAPWFGTARGRAGFALGNILYFGTFGLAYGKGRVDIGSVAESNLHLGWTAGGGLEVALMRNWSVKAEYLHIDLGPENYGLIGTRNGLTSDMIRLGAAYHF
jgi:outer membrane immunogenic protein